MRPDDVSLFYLGHAHELSLTLFEVLKQLYQNKVEGFSVGRKVRFTKIIPHTLIMKFQQFKFAT